MIRRPPVAVGAFVSPIERGAALREVELAAPSRRPRTDGAGISQTAVPNHIGRGNTMHYHAGSSWRLVVESLRDGKRMIVVGNSRRSVRGTHDQNGGI